MNLSRIMRRVAQPVAGQSLVFSAILFFVLIGFAALAIDTGEAFSRQRQQQAASTAATISGLEALGVGGDDNAVVAAIKAALAANGITNAEPVVGDWPVLDPDLNYYRAFYTQRGSRVEYPVGTFSGSVPPEFNGIRVEVRSARNTIFAQALGVETLEVSADNKATWCQCSTYVFPIAVSTDRMLGTLPGQSVTLTWTKNKVLNAVDEKNHFVWAEWTAGTDVNQRLKESLGGSGDLIKGFTETNPPAGYSNASNNGLVNNEDWVKISDSTLLPGDLNSLMTALKTGKPILLPTFSKLNYTGSTNPKYTSFRSGGFVRVILTGFGTNTITLRYVDANANCPCVDVPQPTPSEVKLALDQKLIWYLPTVNTTSYDIALVVDVSGSMKWCWNTKTTCGTNSNARWYLVKEFLRKFSYKMLNVWNAPAGTNMNNPTLFPGEELTGQGGDNRISVIRFSDNVNADSPSFGFVNSPTGTDPLSVKARTDLMKPKMTTFIDWITSGNMGGSTAGAAGLDGGIRYFDNVAADTRKDELGRPIKLVIMMLTDGLTNVMFEGNKKFSQNTQLIEHRTSSNTSPKYCKDPRDPGASNPGTKGHPDFPVTDLPDVQANCPWNGEGSSAGYARAPIASLIQVADRARNRAAPKRPITILAILVGDQERFGLADLRIDRIASSGGAFYAKDPNSFNNALRAIIASLAIPCYPRDALIPAASAKVTVRDSTGAVVAGMGNMQAATDGTLIFTIPEPGNYSFIAERRVTAWSEFPLGAGEVIDPNLYKAPRDPRLAGTTYLPQLYNRLQAAEDIVYRNAIPFSIPEDAEGTIDLGKYTMIIAENEAFKGVCP
ncbi:VWA domain-containing protein [Herpetosiphon llansteffanensis]|uniref:VWA domain-containing protein n=1 Tax=Herpetosiphon llansteffanensis TaxID=2094568 RepID=UPI000D7CAA51|nr:VWA domain-containing protein [Herpetosiphon llansteffanensis]